MAPFRSCPFSITLVAEGRLKSAPFAHLYNRLPRKVYAVIGSAAGFFVAGYTDVLLNATARPLCAATDPLLGALFIASGASTGTAAIALVMAWKKMTAAATFDRLEAFDRVAMVVELLLIVTMIIVAGRFASPLLHRAYALMFWGGTVILGILIPFGLYWYADRRSEDKGGLVTLTAALVLFGGAVLRISLVQAGQM